MNSFRFLERGIDAEIARQERILAEGGDGRAGDAPLRPATRGALTSLRSKEEAHDYRYFPEPDLVPLAPTEEMLERARAALPELPAARAERLRARARACRAETAKLLAFRAELGDFYEAALAARRRRPARARQLDDERADRAPRRRRPGRTPSSSPPRSRGSWRWWPPGRCRPRPRSEVLDVLVAEGGDPRAVVEAQGLGRAGEDELGDRRARDRRQPDAVEKIRRQGQGDRRAIGGDARDQGPRRRRRGPAPDRASSVRRRDAPSAPDSRGRRAAKAGHEARRLPEPPPPEARDDRHGPAVLTRRPARRTAAPRARHELRLPGTRRRMLAKLITQGGPSWRD